MASTKSAIVIARSRCRVSQLQLRVPSHALVAEAAPTDAVAPIIHWVHMTAPSLCAGSVPPRATRAFDAYEHSDGEPRFEAAAVLPTLSCGAVRIEEVLASPTSAGFAERELGSRIAIEPTTPRVGVPGAGGLSWA